jgi:heat shock protein HslJ
MNRRKSLMRDLDGLRQRVQHRVLPVLLALGFATALAACGQTGNDTKSATYGVPDVLENLTANPWIFQNGQSSPPIRYNGPIRLRFSVNGTLSGTTPCGSYAGRFTVHGSDLRIMRAHYTTTPFCAPPARGADVTYLAGLQRVRTVKPTNRDQLRLTGVNVDFTFSARIATEP